MLNYIIKHLCDGLVKLAYDIIGWLCYISIYKCID